MLKTKKKQTGILFITYIYYISLTTSFNKDDKNIDREKRETLKQVNQGRS